MLLSMDTLEYKVSTQFFPHATSHLDLMIACALAHIKYHGLDGTRICQGLFKAPTHLRKE
jgi:hypothetical protein